MTSKKSKIYNLIYPFITIFILLLIWIVLAGVIGAEIILPTPLAVIKEMLNCFKISSFYISFLNTLLRVLLTFFIAVILGGICGFLAYKSIVFKRLIYPIVALLRSLPTMSIILICLIWFRQNYAPVIISFIVLFPLCYADFYSNFNSLDDGILQMCKVFNVEKKAVVKCYVIPHLIKNTLENFVAELSLAIKLIITSEALSQTSNSIGLLMNQAKAYLEIGTLFAYTIFALLLAVIFEVLLKLIIKKIYGGKKI